MPASALQANPLNWRTHPSAQTAALEGVLREVGFAGALLARETAGGGLVLIDGHLRKDVAGDQDVPVLVLDVTEAEARVLLASYDPLGAMAETNAEALEALLREVTVSDAALQEMLAGLAEQAGITPPDFQPTGVEEQGRLDQKTAVTCPECGHEFTP